MMKKTAPTNPIRRRVLLSALAITASFTSSRGWTNTNTRTQLLAKKIPSSGEQIPPIGMGTWITFNIGSDREARAQREQVLRAFFEAGGGMIDSSPMYGSAQDVLGDLLSRLAPDNLFSATKIWTDGDGEGQINEAFQLWRRDQFDLLQVHNLVNWPEHLARLKEMKEAGSIRYLGITTSHGRRHAEMEKIMQQVPLDFIQLTYNPIDREAEQRLLPLAQDKGIAVIVNRPFRRGGLTQRLQNTPLPGLAADLACDSWAQLLLKFTIAHPAVSCAIPATSNVEHMVENMRAGNGPMPTASQREQIAELALRG